MINKNSDPRRGMKVPEGFFDKIEEDILREVSEAKVLPLWSRSIFKYASVAAIVIAIIGVSYLFSLDTLGQEDVFADISEDLHWEYLLENYDDITYDEIADFEEYEVAISKLENELYSDFASEEIFEDIDLETIRNLYE